MLTLDGLQSAKSTVLGVIEASGLRPCKYWGVCAMAYEVNHQQHPAKANSGNCSLFKRAVTAVCPCGAACCFILRCEAQCLTSLPASDSLRSAHVHGSFTKKCRQCGTVDPGGLRVHGALPRVTVNGVESLKCLALQ